VLGGGLAQEAGSSTAGMIIFMKPKILRDSAGGLQLFTEWCPYRGIPVWQKKCFSALMKAIKLQ
jgi:hypothetical protein